MKRLCPEETKPFFYSVLVLCFSFIFLLFFSALAYPYAIQFNWNDNAEADFSHYNIYRSDDGCVTYQETVKRTVSDYLMTDVQLVDGDYCWDITAVDFSGNESSHTAGVNIMLPPILPDTEPPVAPTGIEIIIIMDDGSRWTCDFNGCALQ